MNLSTDDYSIHIAIGRFAKPSAFILTIVMLFTVFATTSIAAEAPSQYGNDTLESMLSTGEVAETIQSARAIRLAFAQAVLNTNINNVTEPLSKIELILEDGNDDSLQETDDTNEIFNARVSALQNYFKARGNLPAGDYAYEIVTSWEEATGGDESIIPWTMVPAIMFLETTGCKYTIENHATTNRKMNCTGLGNMSFPSIPENISYTTDMIAGIQPKNGHYYKGKSYTGRILTYNSVRDDYLSLHKRISANMEKEFVKALAK